MITVDFPTLTRSAPGSMAWGLRSRSLVAQSPISGTTQTLEQAGSARWTCTATYQSLDSADAAILEAWLAALRGLSGRARIPRWDRPLPRGTARGSALTVGATAAGAVTLSIDGLAAGATLLAGDVVQIGTQLLMVTASATASAGGAIAALAVTPPVRSASGDNTTVTLEACRAVMRLADDGYQVPVEVALRSTVVLAFEEA